DQKLHADRSDVPARGGEPAEQRFAARFLVEMEGLRIELRGKFLDRLGGEGKRSQFTPLPDRHLLEEAHQARPSRRRTMIGEIISHSTSPPALRAAPLSVTIPVSGRLLDSRASVTSTSSIKLSSGLKGVSQRTSLTPGEPMEAVRPMKPSNIIRIMIEQRCQPEPERPCSIEAFAASSSRCIGCGSNSAAKASISSRVTWRGPNVPRRPGGKSSKVRVMIVVSGRRGPIVAALCSNLNPGARMARATYGAHICRGTTMFEFQDLFQWDRFITPTIIKTFYWLVIALICLFGLSGIFSGLAAMAISPFGGFLVLLSSIASIVVGIVFSRIVAEFILIVFRINEHLGAIRDQGGMREF